MDEKQQARKKIFILVVILVIVILPSLRQILGNSPAFETLRNVDILSLFVGGMVTGIILVRVISYFHVYKKD
ncbi:MAG: hypothetical protein ACE5D2_08750 [Fidelibacterota bacterium]